MGKHEFSIVSPAVRKDEQMPLDVSGGVLSPLRLGSSYVSVRGDRCEQLIHSCEPCEPGSALHPGGGF